MKRLTFRLAVLAVMVIFIQNLIFINKADGFVSWTDPNGSADSFYWANGGSDFGLFGNPNISENTFSFSPSEFLATSLDGLPADVCDILTFDLIAKPGFSITEIHVSEGGLYDILIDGLVNVTQECKIENLLTHETKFGILNFTPSMPITSGTDTWTITATISGFNWTHLRLFLYNDLYAQSDYVALVDKKAAGTPLITIIPEPATIAMLLIGSLAFIPKKMTITKYIHKKGDVRME